MALYGNTQLTGIERKLQDHEIIVSKTDLAGKITYANQTFLRIAGFTEAEILGKPHNLIRHPEIPRCVFYHLWSRLKEGKEVFAYVNNRTTQGDHYWVFAHITPSYDANGEIIAYHSSRRAPDRAVLNHQIIPLYAELLTLERSIDSPKASLQASSEKVQHLLGSINMSFNEYMFSLTA